MPWTILRVVSGSPHTFDYLHLNESDPDGDALEMVRTNGVGFIPAPGFAVTTSITYVVGDGGLQATGTAAVGTTYLRAGASWMKRNAFAGL